VCELHPVHADTVEAAKAFLLDEGDAVLLAETFKVLSDPTRVKILHALSFSELCVCDLGMVLGMSSPAVSHHLRLLKALKLVKHRKDGRTAYYSLDDNHIETLFAQGLDHIREDAA
jgi:DNA-binding transcriptional ArsR family regulator